MSPHGRDHDVELLALEAVEGGTEVGAVHAVTEGAKVHVEHD